MNKNLTRLGLTGLAVAFLAQAPARVPPARTTIAVYPIKPAGAESSVASALTMLLTSELTPSPRLRVIEEAMLKQVMERQAMNLSDACDDTACQVAIGKLVQAQKIVTGGLAKLGNKYILSLNLVDVQTGATEFSTKEECACPEDQLDKLVAVAGAKVRRYFGDSVPIPPLPSAGGDKTTTSAQPLAIPFIKLPSSAPPTAANWVPGNYTIQESHPAGTKGGPMMFISDFKFYLDKYEVTNQDYLECVAARVCAVNEKTEGYTAPNQPVGGVTQNDARTYCQWAGKRLPTEKEWLQAAQGTDGREYPWGNQPPDCNLANFQDCKVGRTLPVGSKPEGASPYGVLDLAGNAWEWVEERGQVRGGSCDSLPSNLSVSYTYRGQSGHRYPDRGFRCAR
jgi:hypothetical protein